MINILLATGAKKVSETFERMISEILSDAAVVSVIEGGRARLRMKEIDPDLVIINTPMADEQGIEFAVHAADSGMHAVILITNPETYSRVASRLEEHGIIAMKRPIEKKVFSCALKDAVILNNRIRALKRENEKLQESIEESKLVSRAKGMLMSHLNMTEAQAHRYIEKQAMDLRIAKKTVSQNILKTYYNK